MMRSTTLHTKGFELMVCDLFIDWLRVRFKMRRVSMKEADTIFHRKKIASAFSISEDRSDVNGVNIPKNINVLKDIDVFIRSK